MVHVFSVDSGTAEEMNSGEYAVGGYCEEAAAYLVSGMDDSEYHMSSVAETYVDGAAAEGMSDICDMCGQLLPPLADEHLRQKHIQVKNACSSLSTLMTESWNNLGLTCRHFGNCHSSLHVQSVPKILVYYNTATFLIFRAETC